MSTGIESGPIWVLNGPNLNLLGERDPSIYGTSTLADVEKMCRAKASQHGFDIEFRQTNSESELIAWIQEAAGNGRGLVLNPAAFTHYSIALREAVSGFGLPAIEVHISNIYAREEWRAHSVISGVVEGVIAGLGVHGYVLAIEAIARVVKGAQ